MNRKHAKIHLVVALGLVLAMAPLRGQFSGPGGATEGAPLSAGQLQALLAPIALYPDALVAQILSASTFPDQVAVANYWVKQHKYLTGGSLVEAVDAETWDVSVKALTAFPSVLDNMSQNLGWTSSLGEAYHNQSSQVMQALQALRAKAKAAGTLKSSSQVTVMQASPGLIEIVPANPQIVYVPIYNPATIYGVPYVVPGYTVTDAFAAGAIGFGAGVAVGALMGSTWGWNTWGCDWHGGVVVYNHTAVYGNAAWHGAYYHGGYHSGGYGYANAYDRAGDWNRAATRSYDSDAWAHDASAFHADGWSSRADSMRGWGSMYRGGFSGGRFAGGGFGGGGFHGGFRR